MRDGAKLKEARELRRNESLAEKRVWEQLRNRQLANFKFVRQMPIGPFIADFVCREKKLVVEIDGWTHSTADERAYDASRTASLESKGYRVIRFDYDGDREGLDGLLTVLLEELRK